MSLIVEPATSAVVRVRSHVVSDVLLQLMGTLRCGTLLLGVCGVKVFLWRCQGLLGLLTCLGGSVRDTVVPL